MALDFSLALDLVRALEQELVRLDDEDGTPIATHRVVNGTDVVFHNTNNVVVPDNG